MSEPEKIWMRSIAHHTYWNIIREPETFYQVDTEQDASTLIALKMAVREQPPAKAQRRTVATPITTTEFTVGNVRHGAAKPIAPMTTADFGVKPKAQP